MMNFLTIIKLDFLQRTRSYTFLITLCATLAIAYTFVPEPNANYSTIRIADYVGYYNSAWFGYVTAIMTSIFLSLIGFYLVNSGIKTDANTRVGQIVAATKIKNFNYLFSKVLSNFLLLLTIAAVVFIMSIILFFLYNDGYPFKLFQFIKPYAVITIPALFLISVLAVISEMFLGKYSVVQNVGFFVFFSILMVFSPKTENQFSLDIFGSKIVMHKLEETVREIMNTDKNTDLSIGYVLGNTKKPDKFLFEGIDFSASFLLSRLIWVALGILLLFLVSILFHRFDIKERFHKKTSKIKTFKQSLTKDVNLSKLPITKINYSVFPLLKTEILLLLRKGKKWLWIINLIGMVLLAILPLKISHQMVLPILWFLQVSRLSDLSIKETTNNVHYFSFTAYKPLRRLLVSQLLSGIILMLFLALPLIVRLGLLTNTTAVISILLGSVFITSLAVCLGILSKGKKLFEVLFFMITYANTNGIVFVDYFGGFEHSNFYLIVLTLFVLFFCSVIFIKRKHELNN